MNIFVGNLLFEATEEDVRMAFEAFGAVSKVTIVMDKKGKNPRGFCFVEMPDEQESQQAIAAMNAKEFMGRVLIVSPALPKKDKEREAKRKQKLQEKLKAKAEAKAIKESANLRDKPAYPSAAKKKIGRRTRRFLEKRADSGITEPLAPRPKHHFNPMRWRKRQEQPKPWQKKEEGAAKPAPKPWYKSRRQKTKRPHFQK
ncbi:MAG: hypothetical protein FJZ15_01565 [Candidatus Omnitrophica bacterium]|nr:hypothetical protein [Candidatus Omnitrophota bacterium]